MPDSGKYRNRVLNKINEKTACKKAARPEGENKTAKKFQRNYNSVFKPKPVKRSPKRALKSLNFPGFTHSGNYRRKVSEIRHSATEDFIYFSFLHAGTPGKLTHAQAAAMHKIFKLSVQTAHKQLPENAITLDMRAPFVLY